MSENALKLEPPARETHRQEFLSHPALAKYPPSERRAIVVHRFYLCKTSSPDVTIEETIRSWELGVARQWRREKTRRDRDEQLKEIDRHKYFLSQRAGYDVGWESAAKDWIEKHAAAWRDWWEEQPESGA